MYLLEIYGRTPVLRSFILSKNHLFSIFDTADVYWFGVQVLAKWHGPSR